MDRRSFLEGTVGAAIGSVFGSGVTKGTATQNDKSSSASSESYRDKIPSPPDEDGCPECNELQQLNRELWYHPRRYDELEKTGFIDQLESVAGPEDHTFSEGCEYERVAEFWENGFRWDVHCEKQGHDIGLNVEITEVSVEEAIDVDIVVNE